MKVYDATKDTLACASAVVKTGPKGKFYCNFIGFYEPNPTNTASSGNFGVLGEIMVWCPTPQPSALTLMDSSRMTDLKGLIVDQTRQHTKKLTLK